MTKKEAVRQAESKAVVLGGIWHVVKLGSEYYEVHEAWFKRHKGVSLYKTPNYFESKLIIKKIPIYRRVVIVFNRLLLWLFKGLINARNIYSKT